MQAPKFAMRSNKQNQLNGWEGGWNEDILSKY